MFIVRWRGPAQPVKLWGVECSGDDLGCRGKMCVLLTPCRDSRARTFLECMEDLSTKETCPPHIREKELRCGSGKWHTLFGTADQIDGTERTHTQFHLAMQWLFLAIEQ